MMIVHQEPSERKEEVAFRMVIEPGNPARHSPQIKNKGIKARIDPFGYQPSPKSFYLCMAF